MGPGRGRRTYSRVRGAATAKRPAALGHAVAGPALLFGLLHFRCTHVAAATRAMDTSTRIADSAFTSGVTADFSMPYTLIGRVVEPTPAVKKLMMKDRKSTRLNSSHANISYAVFCLKKKTDGFATA